MLETFQNSVANQYEAAFCTMKLCLDRCPGEVWHQPVARSPYSQVMFHTLFFTDYYLGQHADEFRDQAFHSENPELFADYEQLQDREPVSVYEKHQIDSYLQHCRDKASRAIVSETEQSLGQPCQFARRDFTRAELYVYNLRHVYHHAAQLTLRLRLDTDVDIPWVGSGWMDD